MKTVQFEFDAQKVKTDGSPEQEEFKNKTQDKNVIYFFLSGEECVYIGETGCSLCDRCFKNTPKHIDKDWFDKCNQALIIKLDDKVNGFARRAIEASFISVYKSAGYKIANKR